MMARYRDAIEWIAHNDEEGEEDPEIIATSITVGLVADVWNKPTAIVAEDIADIRRRFFH